MNEGRAAGWLSQEGRIFFLNLLEWERIFNQPQMTLPYTFTSPAHLALTQPAGSCDWEQLWRIYCFKKKQSNTDKPKGRRLPYPHLAPAALPKSRRPSKDPSPHSRPILFTLLPSFSSYLELLPTASSFPTFWIGRSEGQTQHHKILTNSLQGPHQPRLYPGHPSSPSLPSSLTFKSGQRSYCPYHMPGPVLSILHI